jgi:hypothetical protein
MNIRVIQVLSVTYTHRRDLHASHPTRAALSTPPPNPNTQEVAVMAQAVSLGAIARASGGSFPPPLDHAR